MHDAAQRTKDPSSARSCASVVGEFAVVRSFQSSFVPKFESSTKGSKFVRSIVPKFRSSFHSCKVPKFRSSFHSSFVRSFVRSFQSSVVRSFVPKFQSSFVPTFQSSFVRSFQSSFRSSKVRSFQSSTVRSDVPMFVPTFQCSFVRSFLEVITALLWFGYAVVDDVAFVFVRRDLKRIAVVKVTKTLWLLSSSSSSSSSSSLSSSLQRRLKHWCRCFHIFFLLYRAFFIIILPRCNGLHESVLIVGDARSDRWCK